MKKLKLLLSTVLMSLCACSGPKPVFDVISPFEDTPTETSEPETPTEEPEEPNDPHNPKVYEVSDLVSYFNAKGEAEGIAVVYIEEKDYWYLHYIGIESTDESKDNLSLGISSFLQYIPLYRVYEGGYLFVNLSKYITDPETYFIYVAVSSNWFAACSIYSYIEDEHLITDIIIYDGRNGLYTEKEN